MDHPGPLSGQDAGCIAPNGLGCNHSAGALSADRMLQAGFLRPDAMPICLEQTVFLLMLPYQEVSEIPGDAESWCWFQCEEHRGP